MHTIYLDFETRSACSLKTHGARRYALHPTTDILCCSYMLDGVLYTWTPDWVAEKTKIQSAPAPWEHGPAQYVAHNSAFDRLIWNHVATRAYQWPVTDIPDWRCSAVIARVNGLPSSLDGAARALRLTEQKANIGAALIRKLSQPKRLPDNGKPVYYDAPDALRQMMEYCAQDVRVGQALLSHLRPLSEAEQQEFFTSERINQRGIGIDVQFAEEAVLFGDAARTDLNVRLIDLTDGVVTSGAQYARIKAWLKPHLTDEALAITQTTSHKICLDKAVRQTLLDRAAQDPTLMTHRAKEVIKILQTMNHNSIAKYARMAQRHVQGRLHDAYEFWGAASTGRFSAHGVQPHNMRRDTPADFDRAREALHQADCETVIPSLATMMRPTLRARPGHLLHWSDWANVEGRACPWLALSVFGEQKLDLFREQDADPDAPDVYTRMAARMGVGSRQTGKIAELALQFGGGAGALQAMARAYNVTLPDDMCEQVITAWRSANAWAHPFWTDLRRAAEQAMDRPYTPFGAGRVYYTYTPLSHNGLGALWCELPSGRNLAYVAPRFEESLAPWDASQTVTDITALKASRTPQANAQAWPRHKLWYGVLTENITQAVCADLLKAALVSAEQAGLRVVMHTHDEIVVESETPDCQPTLMDVMCTPPDWAKGLPLAADHGCGHRYKQAA